MQVLPKYYLDIKIHFTSISIEVKKMTVEYSVSVKSSFCEKCGSQMFPRRIASTISKPVEFIDIIQCDVCKFWHHA